MDWHPYDDAIKREAEEVILNMGDRIAQDKEDKRSAEEDLRVDLLHKEHTNALSKTREQREQKTLSSFG